LIASVKTEAEHFTIFEAHVDKSCVDQFSEAQVRSIEFTSNKLKSSEIAIGKITTMENAVLVFTLGQWAF
jgi:hypothetical protein